MFTRKLGIDECPAEAFCRQEDRVMQELNMNEIEQVTGGFVVVIALALFDVGMIAYDAYQLKHIND